MPNQRLINSEKQKIGKIFIIGFLLFLSLTGVGQIIIFAFDGRKKENPLAFNPNDSYFNYTRLTYTYIHEDKEHLISNAVFQFGFVLYIIYINDKRGFLIPFSYVLGAFTGTLFHFGSSTVIGASNAVCGESVAVLWIALRKIYEKLKERDTKNTTIQKLRKSGTSLAAVLCFIVIFCTSLTNMENLCIHLGGMLGGAVAILISEISLWLLGYCVCKNPTKELDMETTNYTFYTPLLGNYVSAKS